MLVAREGRGSLLSLDRDGDDFCVETSSSDCSCCTCLRREREFVLLFAGHLVLLSENLGSLAHYHFRQGTKESVAMHAVDKLLVPETVSPARAVQIIR